MFENCVTSAQRRCESLEKRFCSILRVDPSGSAAQGVGLRISLAGNVGSIPTEAWMSFSFECCVLSGRGLCVWLIIRQSRPTECGVSH
jgi:hypothetical protein